MKPSRSPAWVRPNGSVGQTARAACRISFTLSALVALILVPLVFGVAAGHGADLGPMAIDGYLRKR